MKARSPRDIFLSQLKGSTSRVFNCLALSRQIQSRDGDAARLMFTRKRMNRSFIVKDTITRPNPHRPEAFTETKVIIPYNIELLSDGGVSYMTESASASHALADAGLISDRSSDADAIHDSKVLKVFNDLPSYAPFLLKDRMSMGGIEIDEIYFSITPDEYKQIHSFIVDRFEAMTSHLIPAEATDRDEKKNRLIERLWKLDDLAALEGIATAFMIPKDRISDVFYGWKGVTFFEYEYSRIKQRMKDFIEWVANDSHPTDFVQPDLARELNESRLAVARGVLESTRVIHGLLGTYEEGFNDLFVRQKGAGGFVEFLSRADAVFWSLGENISKIEHGMSVIETTMEHYGKRKFQYLVLTDLLPVLSSIFPALSDWHARAPDRHKVKAPA